MSKRLANMLVIIVAVVTLSANWANFFLGWGISLIWLPGTLAVLALALWKHRRWTAEKEARQIPTHCG